MIKVDVKDYCHDGCPNFEPMVMHRPFGTKDIIVGCKNAVLCIYLVQHLKEESK